MDLKLFVVNYFSASLWERTNAVVVAESADEARQLLSYDIRLREDQTLQDAVSVSPPKDIKKGLVW